MGKSLCWIRPAVLLSILLLFATTWGMAGPGKLLSGPPEWFSGKFGTTFLATFPGITVSFYSLAIGEVVAALLRPPRPAPPGIPPQTQHRTHPVDPRS